MIILLKTTPNSPRFGWLLNICYMPGALQAITLLFACGQIHRDKITEDLCSYFIAE
jgi:hypothetical protein